MAKEQDQIDRLITDIEAIKAAVKKQNPMMREVLAPQYFRVMALYLSACIFLICGVLQYLLSVYGSYSALPQAVQIISIAFIVFALLSAAVIKLAVIRTRTHEIDGREGLRRFLSAFYTSSIMHVYASVFLAVLAGSVFLGLRDREVFILPLAAIAAGIMIINFTSIVAVSEYYVFGYWLLVSGIASLFLVERFLLPCIMFSFGGSLVAFTAAGWFASRRRGSRAAAADDSFSPRKE